MVIGADQYKQNEDEFCCNAECLPLLSFSIKLVCAARRKIHDQLLKLFFYNIYVVAFFSKTNKQRI